MKKIKKLLPIILSFSLLFSLTTGFDFSAYSATLSSSGSCGENVRYTFNSSTGELVINGTGAIESYYSTDFNSPFYNQSIVKTIVIDSGVTSIGNWLFYKCSGLTSIAIPDTITSIGQYAFSGCTGLTSITVPDSVTYIGLNAFYDVKNIEYNGSASNSPWGAKSINGYVNGNMVYKDSSKKELLGCSSACEGEIIIPNSVTSIGSDAFYNCADLTNIIIPDSVISIGKSAFYSCTGLTSVTIPNSVTSIGSNAFYQVNNIVYNGSASGSSWGARSVNGYVEESLVYKDSSKKELICCSVVYKGKITIPNSVTEIGSSAFSGCTGLTSITIPSSVTSIGSSAFGSCTGLTSIIIPDSVTKIGTYVFMGCSGLISVAIPNNANILASSGIFSECTSLTSVTIPNGITRIGSNVFNRCTNLTNITIPDSVTSIGYNAFGNCTSLTSVTIPDSVTKIDKETFYNCTNLKDLFFIGTEQKWNSISKGLNAIPSSATIHYHTSHSYSVTEIFLPNCTTNGFRVYKCICGDSYKEILDFEHSYELLDSIETTCIDDGLYIYMCSLCGEMHTEEVKAFGHKPNESIIENTINSTCTDKGSYDEVTYCTTCGIELSRKPVITDELGHNVVIDNAVAVTCTTDGLTEGSHCSRCNEVLVEQEVIPALKHNYVITDNQAPNCTIDGYNTYTCQNCNDSYTEIIEKAGHSNYLYRTTAGCEKAGYDIYKCSVCSTLTSVKIDALGHICDSFVGVVDGELNYSCSACGKEYIQSASEIFEKWGSSIINASAEEFPELDVVNDGIINAKDYAMLNHIKNYGY